MTIIFFAGRRTSNGNDNRWRGQRMSRVVPVMIYPKDKTAGPPPSAKDDNISGVQLPWNRSS
jgi:hypothetical protein